MVLLGGNLAPSTCPCVSGVAEELAYHVLQHCGLSKGRVCGLSLFNQQAPLDLGLGSGTRYFLSFSASVGEQ